jgi:hypothetical protein
MKQMVFDTDTDETIEYTRDLIRVLPLNSITCILLSFIKEKPMSSFIKLGNG